MEVIRHNTALACINAVECSNIKTFLKTLNQKATRASSADDEDDEGSAIARAPGLLNYDLRVLQRWCISKNVRHVVVGLPEGEGIDPEVFTQIVTLFQ